MTTFFLVSSYPINDWKLWLTCFNETSIMNCSLINHNNPVLRALPFIQATAEVILHNYSKFPVFERGLWKRPIMKWKYRLLLSRLWVGLCALSISSLLSVCFVSSSELAVIPVPLVLSWFTATLNLIIPTCPCSLALISLFYILISFSVIWWIIPSVSPAPACWSSLVLFL